MKRMLWIGLGCASAFCALAQGPGPPAVRKQIEASILPTSSIVVDEQGKVSSHQVDQPEKIEQQLLDLVNSNIAQWQFQPVLVDGKPVSARNKWSLRLIANLGADDG